MAREHIPYVKSYNAKDCEVLITANGSTWFVTGLGEDMISIEKEEALAENAVGAQGDVVSSVINNGIYNVTITVQATSPQFDNLFALKDVDFFGITINHTGLGIEFTGTKARILELPELALGAQAEDTEFAICVYDGQYTIAKRPDEQ